jgi:hypothetical protein
MTRWILAFVPFLSACAMTLPAESVNIPRRDLEPPAPPPPSGRSDSTPAGERSGADEVEGIRPDRPIQADRLVIYNGWLTLQVPEPEKAGKEVTDLARELGGWTQLLDGPHLLVRVPAAAFDDAVARIALLGQVISRKVTGADVTDQVRDLRIRLDNAEKVRVRLTAILDQAKSVPEALAVERELSRVTEEIERLKGAIAQMQDRISYSTVSIELVRSMPTVAAAISLPFPWVRRLGVNTLFHFEK